MLVLPTAASPTAMTFKETSASSVVLLKVFSSPHAENFSVAYVFWL